MQRKSYPQEPQLWANEEPVTKWPFQLNGDSVHQSCKSGRAFRVGFGPKVDKILGLIRA